MGFSLVGNSGDTNSSTTNYNYTADLNPQLDFTNASGGNLGINFSPLAQGGSTGQINPEIYDYYAPLSIVSTGSNYGDSALNSLASVTKTQLAAQNGSSSATSSTLDSLLSGNTLYWIIGAAVLFFLAESK